MEIIPVLPCLKQSTDVTSVYQKGKIDSKDNNVTVI